MSDETRKTWITTTNRCDNCGLLLTQHEDHMYCPVQGDETAKVIEELQHLHGIVYQQPMTVDFPSATTARYVALLKGHLDTLLSLARRAVEAENVLDARTKFAAQQRNRADAAESRVRELEQQYQEAYMVSVAAKNDAEALRERVRELEEALSVLATEIKCRQHFSLAKDHEESASLNEWADELTDAIKARESNPIARAALAPK